MGDVESELEPDLMDVLGLNSDEEGIHQGEVDVGLFNNDDESSSMGSLHSFAYPPPPPNKTYKKKKEKEEKKILASSSYERKLPPRNRIKRVLPDMISHDDFDLMVKSRKAVKKTNITRLSFSSTTNSAPDSEIGRAHV